jgi:hypothetical protein
MKTTRPRASICFLAALTFAAACGTKTPDDSTTDSSTPAKSTGTPADTSKTAPPATTPAPVDTSPPKPGIDAHVKAELDNRTDGLAGNTLAVNGATAALQTPTTWQTAPKGDVTISGTTDQKTGVAAVESDGGDAKRDAATSALGLTNCQWSSPETVTVGKDKLTSSASDGLCSRGSAQISTAYLNDSSDKLVLVGAWDKAGGDMGSVFSSMRALVKIKPGGDSSGIGPCCDALAGNAKSAPPQQQGFYMAAAGVCNGIRNNPQARQMLGQVRAALAGANMPAACK